MKSKYLITTLALILSLSGVSCKSLDKARSDIPFNYARKLTVNTQNNHRNIVNKGELEGIADLRIQSGISMHEEAFAYLPREQWIEIGNRESYFEEEGSVRIGCFLDLNFLKRLYQENQEVKIYHIHTRLPNKINLIYYQVLTALGEKVSFPSLIRSSLPSDGDLKIMVEETIEHRKFQPNSQTKWGICSNRGVSEYFLTETGLKFFKGKTEEQIINWAEQKTAPIKKPGKRLEEELCNELTGSLLNVTFEPYSN